ncbi:MAG: glycoside hydrolase family 15 protein, partial [Omnitrophica WOR_2 bacterium]
MANNPAPGSPGIEPKWTTSNKSGVGTSYGPNSHVWFTLSHGILNEIYYPRVDIACTRDMGLIITDGNNFFSEEKRNTHSKVAYLAKGIPAYRLTNTDSAGRYMVEKEIITDPARDTVLQRTVFTPLQGTLSDYHVYALLAPHLGNRGRDNDAWVGNYKGMPMLFADRDGYSLALACSTGWRKQSVGYAGVSDGWQDLFKHKQMEWTYDEARLGNVALTGEIELPEDGGNFILAIGFGTNTDEAGQRARASLFLDFDDILSDYIDQWQVWEKKLYPVQKIEPDEVDLYRMSAAVLLCHEAKHFTGGIIASLSIPWGDAKSDNDLGGYHLVWPRDLVETVGGLIAAGAGSDTLRVLDYLQVVQEQDGHWPQNMWLDGRAYWNGVQLDETAFPLILVDTARRRGMISPKDQQRYWPMVRQAAAFLVQNGPVTQEDRWEEDPGYSPFTLAVTIAGLLCAADLADDQGEKDVAVYLRETADEWNACIETWIYVKDTELAKQVGVEGYYVRLAGPDESQASSPAQGYVAIKN